jgi:hypothetical protein
VVNANVKLKVRDSSYNSSIQLPIYFMMLIWLHSKDSPDKQLAPGM